MYLVDFQLKELCEEHDLVTPFDEARVNPASIDLTLGRDFVNLSDRPIRYYRDVLGIDAEPGERFEADKVQLVPGVALLATTAERVKVSARSVGLYRENFYGEIEEEITAYRRLEACVAELRLKSSAARQGLDHALAGWVDPGFEGQLTLELHCHRPVELEAGKAYVQLVVAATLATPLRSYQQTGRYVGEAAQGAVLAKEGR